MMPVRVALFLIIAQAAIGANVIIAKYLVESTPIFLLVALRFVISCMILLTVSAFLPNGHTPKHTLVKRDYLALFAQAMCAGLLFNVFIIWGLSYTQANEAGIITSLLPIVIVVMSFLILKERLNKKQGLAIAIAVGGAICINLTAQGSAHAYEMNLLGNALVFLALIPEGLFTIITKWHNTPLTPLQTARWAVSINAAILFPLIFIYWGDFLLLTAVPMNWLILFLYGLFDTFFYLFWYRGLKQASANVAALFTPVMPVAVILLAWAFLGEQLSLADFIGMLLIMVAIFMVRR